MSYNNVTVFLINPASFQDMDLDTVVNELSNLIKTFQVTTLLDDNNHLAFTRESVQTILDRLDPEGMIEDHFIESFYTGISIDGVAKETGLSQDAILEVADSIGVVPITEENGTLVFHQFDGVQLFEMIAEEATN